MAFYLCPRTTLVCTVDAVATTRCQGLIRHNGETYIVEAGSVSLEMLPGEPNETRWVGGIHLNDTFWFGVARLFADTGDMNTIIDASSAVRMESRVLKYRHFYREEGTKLYPLWFLALALKLLLVLSVGIYLRVC